ncbi:MAG: hypothetical protein PUC32_02800 [Oscillospiraceae bacterium]|nr:hypothetical protein [Oscillospiraceae bacterium]
MIPLTKQKSKKTVAVIDIGSSVVKMILAEQKNNQVHKIDTLKKPLYLGHEVFNTGRISFECLKELCEILEDYQVVMKEYGVQDYTVIATSALREAKNQKFVVDQIKVKTGMTVQICDDSMEKALIYYEVIRTVNSQNGLVPNKKTLISHTGTGSTGLCIHENGVITFSQTLSMGSLKIHDMLDDIAASNSAFDEAAEEYLDSVFDNIVMPFPSQMIDSLVMTGTEMDLVARLCGASLEGGMYRVTGDAIRKLFHQVKNNSLDQLSLAFQISEERAEMLYSSLSIFSRLMNLTQADEILIPKIDLDDAFLRKMLFSNWKREYDSYMEKSAIACAETFAARYQCDPAHYTVIAHHAVNLFDRLKRLHGFTNKHRTILQVAAILHDSGYFVNAKGGCAAEVIRNIDICGLSSEDMKLAAVVANFNELWDPNFDGVSFLSFTEEQLLLCSKLTAIFRLANALDKSRKHKIQEIKVKLRGDEIVLSGVCDQNLYLEKWAVRHCAPFFKAAFGIQPVLQIKSTMI